MLDRDNIAWRICAVTDEDLRIIAAEAENAPPDSAIMAVATNAMYERNEVNGSVSERWRFDARLAMRNAEMEYKSVNITTVAPVTPFIPLSVSEVNEWWRGEVIDFIVKRLLPAIFGGEVRDVE